MSALSFRDVHAVYGPYRALNGLTLEVGDTEAVALIGPNGVGKSTIARVASGLVPLVAGEATVLGGDVRKQSANQIARRGVVHLPEGVGLFRALTIEENVQLRIGGVPRAERLRRMDRAMDLIGDLRLRRRQKAGQLSGGQQRRVAVAAALAAEPKLLLADEPALGLSPAAADEIYEALANVAHSSCALIVIETRLGRIESLCTRAVVVDGGRVSYDGTPSGARSALAARLAGNSGVSSA